jgi:hypothetical protein
MAGFAMRRRRRNSGRGQVSIGAEYTRDFIACDRALYCYYKKMYSIGTPPPLPESHQTL